MYQPYATPQIIISKERHNCEAGHWQQRTKVQMIIPAASATPQDSPANGLQIGLRAIIWQAS